MTYLPALAALIGSGGVIIGLYSFVSPTSAARIYGIPTNPQLYQTTADNAVKARFISKDEAYVYAHGSRNLAIGASIMAMSAFWRFSTTCRLSSTAAQAVKRCVGIALLAGSMVPISDAYIIAKHTKVPGLDSFDVQLGKRASRSHAIRSILWVGVGLTCLFT